MNANSITITGNMGRAGSLNFTKGGQAVWGFSLGYTPRRKNGEQWEDAGPTVWFDVSVWGDDAENLAALYGDATGLATVSGRLGSRSWEKDGQTRDQLTITADAVTIRPKGQRRQQSAPAPQGDPWATSPGSGQGTQGWGGGGSFNGAPDQTEPPFEK